MQFPVFLPKFVTLLILVGLLSMSVGGSVLADDFKDPIPVLLSDPNNGSGNPWAVTLPVDSVKHRKLTFDVTNISKATTNHEFVIIKTDLAPDQLPTVVPGGGVDETQVEIVARIERLAPGAMAQLMVKLKKGNYVLICNVGPHYSRGMRTGFHVGNDE